LNELPARPAAGGFETALGTFGTRGSGEEEAVVCMRPQSILVGPAGQGFPGRVVKAHFLGEVDHLEISVDRLDAPVKARTRAIGQFRPGQDVGLDVASAEALIFSKYSGEPLG